MGKSFTSGTSLIGQHQHLTGVAATLSYPETPLYQTYPATGQLKQGDNFGNFSPRKVEVIHTAL